MKHRPKLTIKGNISIVYVLTFKCWYSLVKSENEADSVLSLFGQSLHKRLMLFLFLSFLILKYFPSNKGHMLACFSDSWVSFSQWQSDSSKISIIITDTESDRNTRIACISMAGNSGRQVFNIQVSYLTVSARGCFQIASLGNINEVRGKPNTSTNIVVCSSETLIMK